jgi:hypothetical protein
VRIRIEDEVEKVLSRTSLYTSEEKLDASLSTRVVSHICVIVHEMDARYVSQKLMFVSWELLYVGQVLDVGTCHKATPTHNLVGAQQQVKDILRVLATVRINVGWSSINSGYASFYVQVF